MSDDAGGMFQTIFGSIRTHFEDRLKSPFAGAFGIAWLATNWKPLLILIFSNLSIEDRISKVSSEYFSSNWNLLWWPLIYAVVGVIAYYVIATIFSVLFETYGVLRRVVERWFDSYRWVDPSTYIATKTATRKQIQELTELAADQLERISVLEDKASIAEAARVAAENSAAEAVSREQDAASFISLAQDREKQLTNALKREEMKASNLEVVLRDLRTTTEKLLEHVKNEMPAVSGGVGSDPRVKTGLMGLIQPPNTEKKNRAISDAERALNNAINLLDK
jgi:hypothetical protein